MGTKQAVIPLERIDSKILLLRGQKVMLDSDLAALYEVEVKALNQAVKRNGDRFPEDFMFQLTDEETEALRSQIVTAKPDGRGGRRTAPYAFTEQGVAMLSSVLRSKRAVLVNVEIMRAFVRLRQMLASNAGLAEKLAKLEKKIRRTIQNRLRRHPPTHGAARAENEATHRVHDEEEDVRTRRRRMIRCR